MEELKHPKGVDPPDYWQPASNVLPLFPRDPAPRRTPPPTNAEILEYRRIRPMLLMLAERAPELMAMMRGWQIVKGPNGCPVMSSILPPDE